MAMCYLVVVSGQLMEMSDYVVGTTNLTATLLDFDEHVQHK